MGEEAIAATALARLEELRAALDAAGFVARVDRPVVGAPRLRVGNPDAAQLHETITCGRLRGGDGELLFFWSWREPICPVVEVEQAAKEIGHVLGAHPGAGAREG